jgi:outer membrane immunogenic protein
MKKLALTAISLLIAGSASAADMRPAPVKAPAPAPVAAYNWTGCYVGAGGGYGMWNQETQYVDAVGGPFGISHDNGGRGWFGTVQVGCDLQVGSNIVIGAFGDYDFSNIKGDMSVLAAGWIGEEKLKNSWAAGGRIGWIPWSVPQLLVFVSGGYTQAKFSDVTFTNVLGAATPFSVPGQTYSGWFLGSGYEYGIGFLPGLFWKTEYRFADYGKERVLIAGPAGGDSLDFTKRVHTVRSELVWRFNFGGPVVARY